MRPRTLVLRAAGTNCDIETAFAFELAGSEAQLVHINELKRKARRLDNFQILAIPGGFTYADDVSAGKILANELRKTLKAALERFLSDGKLIIGICNGFQVLVKAGFLPGNNSLRQTATLMLNDSAKFEDRWTYLMPAKSCCVWTKGLEDTVYLPVAHGEGKFVAQDTSVLEGLKKNNQIVFQYVNKKSELAGYPDNPNGSVENIAGICDATGRVFGLMPHPERHIQATQHPQWTRLGLKEAGDGLAIFRSAVEFIKKS